MSNLLYWPPGRYIPASAHADSTSFAERQRARMREAERQRQMQSAANVQPLNRKRRSK